MKGVGEIVNNSLELNENIPNVVLKHSNSIIRAAFTYVKNISDAEDIAQNTFLSYMFQKHDFESEEHEKAWLIRVAINKSKNFLKTAWLKNRRQLTEDLSYLSKEENDVLKAVLALDKKYRLPIHLHYYEGYSIKEIADILQTKPSTIGTWLARGRKVLKLRLGGFDNE